MLLVTSAKGQQGSLNTVKYSGESLDQILSDISTRYNVKFAYSRETLPAKVDYSFTLNITSLETALDQLCQLVGLSRIFTGNHIVLIQEESEQEATDILIKGFASMHENYYAGSHFSEGFFRETLFENNKAIYLLESVVQILDSGFSLVEDEQEVPFETVSIKEVRSSDDFSRSEIKSSLEQFNSLAGLLKWNKIRYLDSDLPRRLEMGYYHLDSVVIRNDRALYVISFNEETNQMALRDTYYIDFDSYAIVRYSKSSKAKSGFYLNNEFPLSNDSGFSFRLKEDNSCMNMRK